MDFKQSTSIFVLLYKIISNNQNIRETLEKWLHIEEFITFRKVTFYTVRFERDLEMDDMSETDKFFHKFENDLDNTHELDKMTAFLEELGENFGANKALFRHERRADALPPNKSIMKEYELLDFLETDKYRLRLYCLRLSDSVVILFNGGLKTHNDPEKCDNVSSHFKDAQIFAKKISEKLNDKDFRLSKGSLRSNNNGELAFKY